MSDFRNKTFKSNEQTQAHEMLKHEMKGFKVYHISALDKRLLDEDMRIIVVTVTKERKQTEEKK